MRTWDRRPWPWTATPQTIAIIVERLVRDFMPLKIILFGSQARREADQDSDVDLLVVMPDGTSRRTAQVTIYQTLADLLVAVDIVVTTPTEIQRFGTIAGTILRPALREGTVLYERQ